MARPAQDIIDALQPAVGLVLEALRVRTHDTDFQNESELQADCFYVGGELLLEFIGHPLFVSWAQGLERERDPSVAVEDDCSVTVRSSSFCVPTAATVEWDLGGVEPWRILVGEALQSVRVLTLSRLPNLIELVLGGRKLVLANSAEWLIGAGSDLLVGVRSGLIPHCAKELWAS
jgi:hypothetical protein